MVSAPLGWAGTGLVCATTIIFGHYDIRDIVALVCFSLNAVRRLSCGSLEKLEFSFENKAR
jgi:hypothetical protein